MLRYRGRHRLSDEAPAVPGTASRRGGGAAGTEAGPGSPAAPAWCERNWHNGECCEASAEQYALAEAAFTPPAGAEAAVTAAAGPGVLGEAIAAYKERIRRLDAMTPQQLLEFAVFVAGADPELADQALDVLLGLLGPI